jgi:hypothetical protein
MAQSVSDLRRFKDALTQVRVLVPACSGYLFQSLLPGGIAEPSAFLETMPSAVNWCGDDAAGDNSWPT